MKKDHLLRELSGLTPEELERKEQDLKKELFNLRFQLASGRVENPARVRQVRREVARVKTVARQKVVGGGPSVPSPSEGVA